MLPEVKKKRYQGLKVEVIEFEAGEVFLTGSVAEGITIQAVGQETEEVDFQESGYELEWGTNFE